MPIDLSDLSPEAAVTVAVISGSSGIEVSFARYPDPEVLRDILDLKKYPGFQVVEEAIHNEWKIYPAAGWNKHQIAERIASALEKQHGLTVARKCIEGDRKTPVESFV